LVDADTLKDNRERKSQIQAEIQRIKKTVIKPLPEVNATPGRSAGNPDHR
jgi:tRNA uridine 5-carboxymethylaminomethyl modification enzyme